MLKNIIILSAITLFLSSCLTGSQHKDQEQGVIDTGLGVLLIHSSVPADCFDSMAGEHASSGIELRTTPDSLLADLFVSKTDSICKIDVNPLSTRQRELKLFFGEAED